MSSSIRGDGERSDRNGWGSGGKGKDRKFHSLTKKKKVNVCGCSIISEESQENETWELLTLNPKVTFKIPTFAICVT